MSLFVAHISLRKPPASAKTVVFHLAAGETAYITAPNGCGKTRAARQLCGLDHTAQADALPSTGTFGEWRGKRLAEYDARSRATDFGFIPSNPQLLFSMVGRTLRQELELAFGALGRDVDDYEIDRVADWFELRPLMERDYREFSGGEQMRAGLACVLVKRPKVVVTDQVADQIDPEFRQRLFTVLARWSREGGGILLHFSTAMRDDCEARHYGFLTGQQFISGTPKECWERLGCDRISLLGGAMRLGAILHQESLAIFDSMPRDAKAVADALGRWKPHSAKAFASQAAIGSGGGFTASIREFCYPDGVFHLRDVTLRVPSRTLCAVLGANGAGKTTLLKCIANLVGPWKGAVSINCHDYDMNLSLPKTARLALYCFQNPDDQIYKSTVGEELLECVRNISGDRALASDDLQLAKAFGLTDYLGASPFELPLSLRRLLIIASCLIAKPPLLLLDEPTAWLDAFQKKALETALFKYLSQGGCALTVSHDLDWVSAVASQLVFLSDGKIVQQVESPVLPASQSLPYPPTCLQVAEHIMGYPRFWREKDFLDYLRYV